MRRTRDETRALESSTRGGRGEMAPRDLRDSQGCHIQLLGGPGKLGPLPLVSPAIHHTTRKPMHAMPAIASGNADGWSATPLIDAATMRTMPGMVRIMILTPLRSERGPLGRPMSSSQAPSPDRNGEGAAASSCKGGDYRGFRPTCEMGTGTKACPTRASGRRGSGAHPTCRSSRSG